MPKSDKVMTVQNNPCHLSTLSQLPDLALFFITLIYMVACLLV